jgi:hypothetical protein
MRACHQAAKKCLGDLSDAEAQERLGATPSPIIWHLGHLVIINAYFAWEAGVAVPAALPARYSTLFGAERDAATTYPPLDEVASLLDATYEALDQAVLEADLEGPCAGSTQQWKTIGDMVVFANNQRWYHVGGITAVRALMGKPSLSGIDPVPE